MWGFAPASVAKGILSGADYVGPMDSQTSWLATAAVLTVSLLAGCSAVSSPDAVEDQQNVTVNACDSLPDYDYERMVERVEEIKGMQLKRNLSICVEQSSDGIDATTDQRQFAYVEESGLSFFGLGPTANSGRRSSLGHTEMSLNGGPVRIFLANESVVEDISPWVSYEGLVAHELSHAIDDSHLRRRANDSVESVEARRTTDWLLANRAVGEGSATYVSRQYVQQYGGTVNVSKLEEDERGWKHQILVSVYSEGYRYSRSREVTSPTRRRVNSTAKILHPARTEDPSGLPARVKLSIESPEHVRSDRVGELFIREVLRFRGLGQGRATDAAKGWANDRLDYYQGDGFTVVTWRVLWRTERDRSEFVTAYDATYNYTRANSISSISCNDPGRYLITSGKTVTVVSCRH